MTNNSNKTKKAFFRRKRVIVLSVLCFMCIGPLRPRISKAIDIWRNPFYYGGSICGNPNLSIDDPKTPKDESIPDPDVMEEYTRRREAERRAYLRRQIVRTLVFGEPH